MEDVREENLASEWDGPDDPRNPFNWPKRKKWMLTLTACTATMLVLLNSTSVTVAAAEIDERFHIDESSFPNSYWLVTSWTMAAAVVPLVALPLMEDFGVRHAYLAAYTIFAIFILLQAFARNFATMIVARVFSGGAAGILIIVLGGIISDVWDGPRMRSLPMNIYVASYVTGLALGPVMAGAILKYLYWRWILYISAIIYFSMLPVFFVIIKETRHSAILVRSSRKAREKAADLPSAWSNFRFTSVLRPLKMLVTEWVIFSFTLWSAFSLGTVYLFTQSTGQVYSSLYGWPESSRGLIQSAVAIGQLLGLLAELCQDRIYFKSAARNVEVPGAPIPEARLYLSIGGSLLVAAGFFIYAWTSYSNLPWIAPTIGLACVSFGSFTVVTAVNMYVSDAYAKYTASAFGAVSFGENVMAAFLPLAARKMYATLGFQWASSLLGFVALVLTAVPIVLLISGRTIRAKSPFMSSAAY